MHDLLIRFNDTELLWGCAHIFGEASLLISMNDMHSYAVGWNQRFLTATHNRHRLPVKQANALLMQ